MFAKCFKSLRIFPSFKLSYNIHSHAHHKISSSSNRKFNVANGNKLAADIRKELKQFIHVHSEQIKEKPGIAFLVINDRIDTLVYMKKNLETWNELGINFFKYDYSGTIDEETILAKIDELNKRDDVHGIMLKQPLPPELVNSTVKIINAITPAKDVEGVTDENMARIFFGETDLNVPCTPAACLHILKAHNVDLSGKHCLIANKSRIIGLPLSKLLMQQNATITVCNVLQTNIQKLVSMSDIVFTAIGKHDSIKSEWIKDDAIVIDIGMNFIIHEGNKKMVGDIDLEKVVDRVELITPVPGGVGPVTVMMLAKNIVSSWARRHGIPFNLKV